MSTQRLEQKARNTLAQAYGNGVMQVAVISDIVSQIHAVCYWPVADPQDKTVLYLHDG